MKNIQYLAYFAALWAMSPSFAQNVPLGTYDDATRFRINGQRGTDNAGVDFLALASWNQFESTYDDDSTIKTGFFDTPAGVTQLPWDLGHDIELKMDGSTANINSVFNQANVGITKIYNSTINVNADTTIGGRLASDGGMIFNIAAGVTFKAGGEIDTGGVFNNTVRSQINVNGVSGNRSTVTSNAGIKVSTGGDFTASYADITATQINSLNGATTTLNNVTFTGTHTNLNDRFVRAEGGYNSGTDTITYGVVNIADSTIDARVYTNNYGQINLTNSAVTANGGGLDLAKGSTIVVDNSTMNYTNGGIGIRNTQSTTDRNNLETSLIIKNGSTVTVSGGLSMGENNSVSGNASVIMEGSGSTLSVNSFENPNNNNRDGGDFVVHLTGSNNTFEVRTGNVNIDGYRTTAGSTIKGGTVGVLIEGEGNTFTTTKRIHLGRNDSGTNTDFIGGGAYFKASSNNAANRATVVAPEVNLGMSTYAGSTYVTELELGGNTDMYRNADTKDGVVDLRIGSSGGGTVSSGTSMFTVKGDNNKAFIGRFDIGQVNSISGGKMIVDISGDSNVLTATHGDGLRILSDANTSGGEVAFKMGGTNNKLTVESNNGLRILNADVSGGTVDLTVEGSNNTFDIVGGEGIRMLDAVTTGGKADFTIKGSSNTVTVNSLTTRNGLRTLNSGGGISGGEANIIVEGTGNKLLFINNDGNANVVLKNGNGASGGSSSLILRGTNNTITLGGEFTLANSDNATGGDALFEISGTGNIFEAGSIRMGSGSSTDFTSAFNVVGGGNTITISGGLSAWNNGSDGAQFNFFVDNSGITSVDFGSGVNFDVLMNIDFSGVGTLFENENLYFLTSDSSLNVNRTKITVTLSDGTVIALQNGVDTYGNANEGFTIISDGSTFGFNYYNNIPEPGTYAVIFGAIALAIAAYRRRK